MSLNRPALVGERTNSPALVEAAGRIEASQRDEIGFMQQRLAARGETAPDPQAHSAMHTSHEMAGMVPAEAMAALAKAEGPDFDRRFLQLMISHHARSCRFRAATCSSRPGTRAGWR